MNDFDQAREMNEAKKEVSSSVLSTKDEIVAFFIFGIAIAAVVCVIPILAISRTKEAKIASLDQRYQQEVAAQIESLEKEQKDRASVISQIDALSSALSSRTKNSQIFEALNKYTFKKSKWTDFSLDGGQVSLTLVTDSFDDAARAVATFRQMDSVEKVKLTGSSADEETKKIESNIEISMDITSFLSGKSASLTTQEGSDVGATSNNIVL